MSTDRRAHPRFPLVLTVQYLDAETVLDYTENLSASGLFVRTEREFAVGERTTLVVSFPQLLEPVELTVEVVRQRDGEARSPGGVAVRVPDDLPDHRAKLAEVARLVATASRTVEPTYRILLVEDNSLVAQMYAAALRKLSDSDKIAGLGVEVCNDGAAAWDRLLRKPSVDLLITDVFMPVLSGLDLVERLRAEPALANLPVVVITSGGEKERSELAQLGVTLFLQKPVKYPDLADTVRFLMRARQGKVTSPPKAAVEPPKEPSPRALTSGHEAPTIPGTKKPAPSR
ncbi:MAG TPA: response regulator [Anaeromyxobacteraceae bacterium]|nr:response regulator [Anaeromyxobacteraceae bacterium]